MLLGIYHTLAFGGPLKTGYHHNVFAEASGIGEETAEPFLGFLPMDVLPTRRCLLPW